jgi:hypothetical protein
MSNSRARLACNQSDGFEAPPRCDQPSRHLIAQTKVKKALTPRKAIWLACNTDDAHNNRPSALHPELAVRSVLLPGWHHRPGICGRTKRREDHAGSYFDP